LTAFSDYLENALINGTLRDIDYVAPTTVYLGLHTTATNDDDSGTEVSGGSYARQAVTFAAPSGGSTSNSALVTFPTATASWGTVTHFGIYDAVSAGNLLYWGALTVSKTVDNGDIFTVPIGNLTVTLQ
jgi:hypothetical protein